MLHPSLKKKKIEKKRKTSNRKCKRSLKCVEACFIQIRSGLDRIKPTKKLSLSLAELSKVYFFDSSLEAPSFFSSFFSTSFFSSFFSASFFSASFFSSFFSSLASGSSLTSSP